MNSPVRLGVSPAASPATTGVYSQRFEALFPRWSPGLWACLAPQLFLPVYLHMNVGPPGLPATVLPRLLSTWLPVSAPPTIWVSVSSLTPWLSDFHTVRFSDSSGCFVFKCVVVLVLVV